MTKMSLKHLFSLLTMAISLVMAPCSHGLNQTPSQPSSLFPTSTGPSYHGGALMTGPSSINIYLIWYGSFSEKEKNPITDFFSSFTTSNSLGISLPTVSSWWKTTTSYKDKTEIPVSTTVKLVKQLNDIKYSIGKNIKRAQISNYVENNIKTKILPLDSNGVYLLLSSKDVSVERFCISSCGFHDSAIIIKTERKIVYAHVGDSTTQCPGLCAWPYAVPAYGPPEKPLVAPNGVGAEGMIINIATILAGAATNPFRNGYFQGDILAPLEAGTACTGIFGAGAYPGYPGKLMIDKSNKASYNSYGANGRKFLLPALWDPIHLKCMIINT